MPETKIVLMPNDAEPYTPQVKPMLFNAEMVRAILDGRKTVTRRVINPPPEKTAYAVHGCRYDEQSFDFASAAYFSEGVGGLIDIVDEKKPPVWFGDTLWVRETWLEFIPEHVFDGQKYAYRADVTDIDDEYRKELGYTWRPSIHMPKTAARLFLRVTDIRPEHLQEVTEEEAQKEGAVCPIILRPDGTTAKLHTALDEFIDIWNKTIHPRGREVFSWDANPWVWRIEFERIEKPKGWPQ